MNDKNDKESTDGKNLLTGLLELAAEKHISDIHIEPISGDEYQIRVRRGRNLKIAKKLSFARGAALIHSLKEKAALRDNAGRAPLDGGFQHRQITAQMVITPMLLGEKVFLHIMNQRMVTGSLSKLGLSGRELNIMKTVTQLDKGLVLLLGDGKNTTAFNLLAGFDATTLNVSTVEFAGSYRLPGVNQLVAGRGIATEKLLDAVLRQKSHVVMITQLDTPETAQKAVDAALHRLVITSVPVDDPFVAIAFLEGLGVPPFLLASALRIISSQGLIVADKDTKQLTGQFEIIQNNDVLSHLIACGLSAHDLKAMYQETVWQFPSKQDLSKGTGK